MIHGLKVLEESAAVVPLAPGAPPRKSVIHGGGKLTGITVSSYEETESEKRDREIAEEKEREIERGRANLMNRIKEADREREKEKEELAKGAHAKKMKCVEFASQVRTVLTLLYYIAVYCIVLYCIVLYCIVLCCIALCCIVLLY